MKDYIIWLKSGETVTGSVKEDIIDSLKDRFINSSGEKEILSFNDEEGEVTLDLSRVEVIVINKQYTNKSVGF